MILGGAAVIGCEETIEEKREVDVKNDGTVKKETEKTVQEADGTIKKEETKTVDKPNP
jgi:stress response protein YsnF